MTLILPTELLLDILGRVAPTEEWVWGAQYWEKKLKPEDLAWYISLRLVSRQFDSLIFDYFATAVKAQKEIKFCHRDPPTRWRATMGKRLLRELVHNDLANPASTRPLTATIIQAANKAAVLFGPHHSGPGGRQELQGMYCDAMISVLGSLGPDQIAATYIEGHDPKNMGENREEWQGSVLMATAYLGRVEDIKSLLRLPGFDINCVSRFKWVYPPLLAAALGRHLNMVEFLIQEGIDISRQTARCGANIMHFAALGGNVKLVHCLAGKDEVKININTKDNNSHTPLVWAISMGFRDVVQELLRWRKIDNNIPDKGSEADAVLLQALKGKNIGIMDAVISSFPNILCGDTLLRAAEEGSEKCLRYILSRKKVPVNCQGKNYPYGSTPLHLAVRSGNRGKVTALLEQPDIKVNVQNDDGQTPVAIAIAQVGEDMAWLLLVREDVDISNVDNDGNTLLHHASRWGTEDIVDHLLQRMGTNIWHKNNKGSTVLAVAALAKDERLVRQYLDPSLGLTKDIVSDAIQRMEECFEMLLRPPRRLYPWSGPFKSEQELKAGTYQILVMYLEKIDH